VRIITPKGGRPFATTYTPRDGDYAKWHEQALVLLRAAVAGLPPLEGPLGLKAVFLFEMPAGEHRKTAARPRRWHEAKPDWDNVSKAIADVLVEAGWLRDDAKIAESVVQKVVAEQGAYPAIHVTLYRLAPYGSAA
jgi:Holliday junction resolvase RusA-like endonuclease